MGKNMTRSLTLAFLCLAVLLAGQGTAGVLGELPAARSVPSDKVRGRVPGVEGLEDTVVEVVNESGGLGLAEEPATQGVEEKVALEETLEESPVEALQGGVDRTGWAAATSGWKQEKGDAPPISVGNLYDESMQGVTDQEVVESGGIVEAVEAVVLAELVEDMDVVLDEDILQAIEEPSGSRVEEGQRNGEMVAEFVDEPAFVVQEDVIVLAAAQDGDKVTPAEEAAVEEATPEVQALTETVGEPADTTEGEVKETALDSKLDTEEPMQRRLRSLQGTSGHRVHMDPIGLLNQGGRGRGQQHTHDWTGDTSNEDHSYVDDRSDHSYVDDRSDFVQQQHGPVTIVTNRGERGISISNTGGSHVRDCFECDVDYFGFDVKKIESGVRSLVTCQRLCQRHVLCDFFTHVSEWGGCYLKHSRRGRKVERNKVLISGMKYCNNVGSVSCHGQYIQWS